MDVRRQSKFLKIGTLLRMWGMGWAVCCLGATAAWGQYPAMISGPPVPAPVYAEPNSDSLYAPQAPQAAFGPGYPGMVDPGFQLPSANGISQPGELQSLNYSQSLGDYGNMQVYGSPDGQSGFGANFQANPATWAHVRDLQVGVYTNDEQTVINGGSTFEFFVNDRYGLGGRILLGGANNDNINDDFHFSGDLYGGTTRLADGSFWFKGGVLYDVQDNFHKVGPAFGALLFADRKHPISLDIAYGIGYGDPVIDFVNQTIVTVADDDTQVRAGTYLTPNLQAGFSGNWVNFADGIFEDYNGYGGFINLNLGYLDINVDYTYGDSRSRGFVNVAYSFGGRRTRPRNDCGETLLVEHPRDWLGKPVMRDVALQLQRTQLPTAPGQPGAPGTPGTPGTPTTPPTNVPGLVGNLTQVNCRVSFDTVGITNDTNNNGVVDPNENFQLDIQVVNGSTMNATNINFGFNRSVSGPANLNALGPGNQVAVLLPNQQSNGIIGTIFVDPQATAGNQVFIDFDVTSDGQTRRFRCGPFVIGQFGNETGFTAATPIN